MCKLKYLVNFINNFTEREESLILDYVRDNINDFELHQGYNYAVDVSHAIGRTANIDILVLDL